MSTATTHESKWPTYPAYKPSGIDWLGEVPEHWEVKRLKHLCTRWGLYGANIPSEEYELDGIRFLRTSDIDDFGMLRDDRPVYVSIDDAKDFLLTDGDLLLSRSGTLGRSFIFSDDKHEPAAYAGYLVRYCFRENVDSQYIFYFTKTLGFAQWINESAISSTIGNVNAQKFANITLTFPPLPEQRTIAAFLDERTAKIDALINLGLQNVDLLTEYRTTLISAAVTGKIDVRGGMA